MNSMHNEWHKTERTDHVHKFYHLMQTSSLCWRAVVAWLAHLLLIDPDTSLVQGKPPRVWVTTYRKQYLHTSGFNTINCTPYSARMSPENTHKLMGFHMEDSILGVIL